MKIYKLDNDIDKKYYLEKLEADKGGVGILSSKMTLHLLYIKDLSVIVMNILKQDALSIGAEVAPPYLEIKGSSDNDNLFLLSLLFNSAFSTPKYICIFSCSLFFIF